MLIWALIGLIVVSLPFILPVLSLASVARLRRQVQDLERTIESQKRSLEALRARVQSLGSEPPREAAPPSQAPVTAAAQAADQARRPPVDRPPVPAVRVPPVAPVAPAPAETPRPVETARPAAVPPDRPSVPTPTPAVTPPTPPAPAVTSTPRAPSVPPPPAPPVSVPATASASAHAAAAPPIVRPPLPPRRPEGPRVSTATAGFDWENVVGVKLFSAIAGIALLLAAIFFLRYSVQQGWLQPPVRVAIGLVVALALLVACELKAARRYPATANALDASAIAILFATFFSAHTLWNLIPGVVAFALLALVTVIAVLLSIRRDSLFIAILGLLGGFATPALLSTGENRPIPLFTYVLLLNIGLAWVSYRQVWPALSWLTVILTTAYEWGWVIKFLDAGQLSLAMGIFVVFPLVTVAALLVAPRTGSAHDAAEPTFERTAFASALLPLVFAFYVATVPGYSGQPWLLLSFLLLIDLGLVAIAIARRQDALVGAAALATLVIVATFVTQAYSPAAKYALVSFTAAFAVLFTFAPEVAAWLRRPFGQVGDRAKFAAPGLLFVYAVLARIEPAFVVPWVPLGTLAALVLVIAWQSARTGEGALYFTAAFFAVGAQATWSVTHLAPETLRTAVEVYALFGIISIGTPLVARRAGHAFQPAAGSGVVVLAALPLLLFFASEGIAPVALWALALLLAILNAGMFAESAAAGLPKISIVGSLASWVVLATWWLNASGSVGVVASLAVLTGMSLVTLAGYTWAAFYLHDAAAAQQPASQGFKDGLFLGLIGHLCLLLLALNPEWSIPPWPLFGTLAVLTLAISVASFAVRAAVLQAAGVIAAACVVLAWSTMAGEGWGVVAIAAAGAVNAFGLAWIGVARTRDGDATASWGAAAALFLAEGTAMAAATDATRPFVALVVSHVATIAVLLGLTTWRRWTNTAVLAAIVSWLAVLHWQFARLDPSSWMQLFRLTIAVYAVFVAYPLILGRRARGDRGPYLAAIVASAMCFFGLRAALEAGQQTWAIGAVPVGESAVLAILLTRLLRIEDPGKRDLGRLALVAGAALAFITVAIPLQLQHQWITIGWALEGAALAWLYGRIPHRGLLYSAAGLLAVVFVRLALNPQVLLYEPRGPMRIVNWYLYAYLVCAVAMFAAAWWLSPTADHLVEGLPAVSRVLPAAAGVLLFLLLNIEIADFYATGPAIAFRFGAGVSQDLTYTIGWLIFGLGLLATGIWRQSHAARVAAVMLIAVTTFKCFLYDLSSLEGLYRVASFVGLAMSLALVSLALQKYVLARPKGAA
jgi:uncharacterized membrane protein